MSHSAGESVPMRRLQIDRTVKLVDGAPLPDDKNLDDHIAQLLDETEQMIPEITFERDNKKEAGRIHFLTTGPKVTYDPSATLSSGVADARTFRTVAMLHEVMHVTCDEKYVKPAWAATDLYGRNFHVATTLTTNDEVGNTIREQQDIVDDNYGRAVSTLTADRSKIITAPMRSYLLERFEYGRGMPDVHYDTVLFEVLVYMAMLKAQETPTFGYLKKLSIEALERRQERPPRDAETVTV